MNGDGGRYRRGQVETRGDDGGRIDRFVVDDLWREAIRRRRERRV